MTNPDTTTNEELRVACAEARGIVECDEGAWSHAFHGNMGKFGKCSHANCYPPGMLPNFPTDHNAAMTLCDALAKEGQWRVTIYNACALWFVCFYKDSEGREHKASGPTLAIAICRAYLAVIQSQTPTT